MDLLARREHAAGELRRKLNARFRDANELVDNEIQRLTEEGLQSDVRLAEAFVDLHVTDHALAQVVTLKPTKKNMISMCICIYTHMPACHQSAVPSTQQGRACAAMQLLGPWVQGQ